MSLSENAESLGGADSGAAGNTGAGNVMLSSSAAMSGMKTRRAEKPLDALLTLLSRHLIDLGWILVNCCMRALRIMSATIKNL